MATKMKENGVQTPSLEARFPIVATNLRALVSSWLPPAREPSPVDEEISANGESEGRQERLALGAKLSMSVPNTQFQNRMNRKLGITTNGISKVDNKSKGDRTGMTDSNRKRLVDQESESEEDSKSKLITKKSKRSDILQSTKDNKTNPVVAKKPPIGPSTAPSEPDLVNSTSYTSEPTKSKNMNSSVPSDTGMDSSTLTRAISPPTTLTRSTLPDLPKLAEIRAEPEIVNTRTDGTNETKEQERKRLKKERKKERKRQKKELERQQKSQKDKD